MIESPHISIDDPNKIYLDPNNKKGRVLDIFDLKIVLPVIPQDKKTILNYPLYLQKQYEDCNLDNAYSYIHKKYKSLSNGEQEKKFYLEEFSKLKNGCWIYLYDWVKKEIVEVYLTGIAYFFWFWFPYLGTTEPPYFFKYFQLEDYYHWAAVEVDIRCHGQIRVKGRREGFTLRSMAIELYYFIMPWVKNKRIGNMSKKEDDAEKILMQIKQAYGMLEDWLKPPLDSNSKSLMQNALCKTTIDFAATKEDSYDGGKEVHMLFGDEMSKIKMGSQNVDFIAMNNQHTPSVEAQGRYGKVVIGKLRWGSTTASPENGGREYKHVFFNSNPNERDEDTGKTSSKLYWSHTFADRTEQLDPSGFSIVEDPKTPIKCPDGTIITTGGRTKVLQARKGKEAKKDNSLEDLMSYKSHLRNFPLSKDDAFTSEDAISIFNTDKIEAQIRYNIELANAKLLKLTRGIFVDEGDKVGWEVHSSGPWIIYSLPSKNQRNQIGKDSDGDIYPLNEGSYVMGVDPIDQGVDNKDAVVSYMSAHIYRKFDGGIEDYPHDNITAHYYDRPQNPEDGFEQLALACKYFGARCLVEKQKISLINYMKRMKMQGYIMQGWEVLGDKKTSRRASEDGIHMNPITIDLMVTCLKQYIIKYIGENDDNEFGHFPFNDTLNELLIYNPKKQTKYDQSVSLGITLLAASTLTVEDVVEDKYDIGDIWSGIRM